MGWIGSKKLSQSRPNGHSNRYFISLISNLLERLRKIKIFIKIDFRGVYNLIRIKENHEWLTAFRTRYELYQYNVMSFELTNASAIFQFYIDRALFKMIDVIVVVYLNDILIYFENKEDHEKHVKKILQALKNHELFVKSEKCVFSTKIIEFLRFIISSEEIFMNLTRVAIIVNWSVLTSIKKIQFFLKFCNFYRRFIRNYSKIALIMTELTKRTTRFEWNSATQTSFESLKNVFKQASLLIQFDSKKHSILMTDASNRVIADILLQKQDDTHSHSIAFHSRKLTSTKQNYETSDQELLIIVNSFKIWRHYLKEAQHKIVILTNYNNLKKFLKKKTLIRRQVHWVETLSAYDFEIKYQSERKNSVDDSSRRFDYVEKDDSYTMISFFRLVIVSEEEIDEVNLFLLADTIKQNIEDQLTKNSDTATYQSFDYIWKGKLLYTRAEQLIVSTTKNQVLRLRILKNFHDTSIAGHFEKNRIELMIKKWFYWSSIISMIYEYVRICDLCQRIKSNHHALYEELASISISDHSWTFIAMNFIIDLSESVFVESVSYNSILIIIDRFSKMTHFTLSEERVHMRGMREESGIHERKKGIQWEERVHMREESDALVSTQKREIYIALSEEEDMNSEHSLRFILQHSL